MRKKSQSVEFIKKCLADALVELMKTDRYEIINVNEICYKAGVARTTYYRHFNNKNGKQNLLLYRLEYDWKEYCAKHADKVKEDIDKVILHFIYENKPLFFLLYENGLTDIVYQAIYRLLGPKKDTPKNLVYMKAAGAGGYYGLVCEWIKNGMTDTPEKIQKDFVAALMNNLARSSQKENK